jgi:LacI family transcriptional regulator
MKNSSKPITIRDIAKMAKVSVGTVDRVIHKRGEVAEDSKKKVMKILEKTGYKPNLLARTLASNKRLRIAVLLPNPKQDEYWALSEEGISEAEKTWAQYAVELKRFHFDLYKVASFKAMTQKVLKAAPDGIIAAPVLEQEAQGFFYECKQRKIPFVFINNNLPECRPLSFIGQDLYQSGMLGAELLHLAGAQRKGTYAILHIYDDKATSRFLADKERGFNDYFRDHSNNGHNVVSLDLNYTHISTLENELNELLSNTDLIGIFITTSGGAKVVSKLLQKKKKNDIKLVAYDLLKDNVSYLKKGVIDFLINQNSKRQAFAGVGELANHLFFHKEVIQDHLFPLEIVTRSNLASYLNSKTR